MLEEQANANKEASLTDKAPRKQKKKIIYIRVVLA